MTGRLPRFASGAMLAVGIVLGLLGGERFAPEARLPVSREAEQEGDRALKRWLALRRWA